MHLDYPFHNGLLTKGALAQNHLIKELTTQVAMTEPLMRTGNVTVLQLLTREAADEEIRAIQQEVSQWKEATNEKQRIIQQRDERIAILEQTGKYQNHSRVRVR